MALLSDADRAELWAEFMRELSSLHEPLPLVKQDLRAAVNAIDQWIEDNKVAMNTAIPLPARTALTTAQKARLFMFVVRQRFIKGA